MTLLLAVGCARPVTPPFVVPPIPPEQPAPGTLFLADSTEITLKDLADQARHADYILLGESHDNPCDHDFQKGVLIALEEAGLSPVIGLEMVPWDKQDVLDAFNRGTIAAEQLEDRLEWKSFWGYSYDLYRPILEKANALGFPIAALNTPKELQDQIRADGIQGVDKVYEHLPPTIIPPPQKQLETLEETFLLHAHMMPHHDYEQGPEMQRFVTMQSLWDTQMAYLAGIWHKQAERPVVILAGSGHVDYGHGIAHRLIILEDNPRILSVVPWRGNAPFDPAMADMFFFCPPTAQPQRLGIIIAWEQDRAVITAVMPGSRAESAGLMPGDALLTADGNPVTSLEVLHQAGKAAVSDGTPLRLEVLREQSIIPMEIPFSP